jgi:hypothetical protein
VYLERSFDLLCVCLCVFVLQGTVIHFVCLSVCLSVCLRMFCDELVSLGRVVVVMVCI